MLTRRVTPRSTGRILSHVKSHFSTTSTPVINLFSELLLCSCVTLSSISCMSMKLSQKCDHQIYRISHLMLTLILSNPQQGPLLERFRLLLLFMASTLCRYLHEKRCLRINNPSCIHVALLKFSRAPQRFCLCPSMDKFLAPLHGLIFHHEIVQKILFVR